MAKLLCFGSGSSGNSYAIRCENETLLIELGLPWKDIIKGLDYDIKNVVGCLVSHEHSDHLNKDTIKKVVQYSIPTYSCESVAHKYKGISIIKKGAKTQIGGFKIQPIPLQHSVECFGFVIEHDDFGKMVFASDCSEFLYRIKNVNHWLIEANWSEDVLIDNMCNNAEMRSRHEQHLEINDTIEALKLNVNMNTQTIVLLHLSNGNSNAKKFIKQVSNELSFSNVHVADKGLIVELLKNDF